MRKIAMIRISFVLGLVLFVSQLLYAQNQGPRKSPKAKVSQTIGVDTEVVIDYGRPGVKGREIWGGIVPYGLSEGNKYSDNKPYPWRAGANENTTISVSKDVMIGGEKLPAGKYSIHMVPGKSEFKIMFNKTNDAWGSYTYNASDDALVVTVTPKPCEHVEWLEYGFSDLSDNGATAYLRWEKLEVPFEIQLP